MRRRHDRTDRLVHDWYSGGADAKDLNRRVTRLVASLVIGAIVILGTAWGRWQLGPGDLAALVVVLVLAGRTILIAAYNLVWWSYRPGCGDRRASFDPRQPLLPRWPATVVSLLETAGVAVIAFTDVIARLEALGNAAILRIWPLLAAITIASYVGAIIGGLLNNIVLRSRLRTWRSGWSRRSSNER